MYNYINHRLWLLNHSTITTTKSTFFSLNLFPKAKHYCRSCNLDASVSLGEWSKKRRLVVCRCDYKLYWDKHIHVKGREGRLPALRPGNSAAWFQIIELAQRYRFPHCQGLRRYYCQIRDLQKFALFQELPQRHLPDHPRGQFLNQRLAEKEIGDQQWGDAQYPHPQGEGKIIRIAI